MVFCQRTGEFSTWVVPSWMVIYTGSKYSWFHYSFKSFCIFDVPLNAQFGLLLSTFSFLLIDAQQLSWFDICQCLHLLISIKTLKRKKSDIATCCHLILNVRVCCCFKVRSVPITLWPHPPWQQLCVGWGSTNTCWHSLQGCGKISGHSGHGWTNTCSADSNSLWGSVSGNY